MDKHVRGELSTLSEENARVVAEHLAAAGVLLDADPERAYQHAKAAHRRAGRMAVVREAAGLAAYRTGRYDEALREFRTVRRLTGSEQTLPLMADCERGRGNPHKALELAASVGARALDQEGRIELAIVAAGARLDLGQAAAAVQLLARPELTSSVSADLAPAKARLMSAYASALAAAGHDDEAGTWQARASAAGVEPEMGGTPDDAHGAIVDLLEGDPDDSA